MRGHSLRGIAAALIAALPLSAQVEVPRLSQSIDVRVTNVDVVVTDSAGKRVHGLTRADFEVFDGGKAQPITNFSEIVVEAPAALTSSAAPAAPEAAAAVPAPSRHLIIFFDALSTTREERRRLTPGLVKLVRELREQDEAMVVVWNRSLRIIVPPTHDRALLEKGIDRGASEISLRAERLTMFGDLMGGAGTPFGGSSGSMGRTAERRWENRRNMREAATDLTDSVRGLEGMLQRLAGLDGRKALILVSTSYSFNPGANSANVETENALEWLENLDAPRLLKELADEANAAGVAIYGIHAVGLHSGWSAAVSGSQVAGAGDRDDIGGFFSAEIPALQTLRASGAQIGGLSYLAARTGGLAAANQNFFTKAFAAIAEDLGSYYSIGYRSPDAVDQRRTIEVRTRDRRYTVRSRHSAIDRSPEAEMSDRVMAALLFPSGVTNQLGIAARVLPAEHGRKFTKVPIDVQIPMSSLTYQSDGGNQLLADVSVLIASADTQGSTSPIETLHKLIPVTRPQLATLAGKVYTYGLNVELKTATAENRFAIAVIDNVSKASGIITIEAKGLK